MKSIGKTILKVLSYLLAALLGCVLTLAVLFQLTGKTVTGKIFRLEQLIDTYFIGSYEPDELGDAAARAMVLATGDRWSYYISARDYQSYEEQMSNSYVGVGITVTSDDDDGFSVHAVAPGGPAEQTGVQPGDLLIRVNGQSCAGLSTEQVARLIRGEEGTQVILTLRRQEQELDFSILRTRFQTPVATGAVLPDGIGLVTIRNFDERCADEAIAALNKLQAQGITSVIFDVRNNPGGYKTELVKLLDYLLPAGDLFISEDYQGNRQVDTSDEACVSLPMAVLVNEDSYSAAEFFGAALSEYGVAALVGSQTCGKGYFQNTFRLPDGSAVALSTGRYYTPKGVCLANVGLTPDVVVPVDEETRTAIAAGQLEPKKDPQIIAAMDALKSGK